jgi:hypothetical protein
MKDKHTPGPWAVEAVFGEDDLSIILGYEMPAAGNPVILADVGGEDEYGFCPATRSEANANARLIASSPELLKELRALCVIIDGQTKMSPNVTLAARWIISKATGEKL